MHKKGCRCERIFANIGCCSKRFWDFAILNCSRGQTIFFVTFGSAEVLGQAKRNKFRVLCTRKWKEKVNFPFAFLSILRNFAT